MTRAIHGAIAAVRASRAVAGASMGARGDGSADRIISSHYRSYLASKSMVAVMCIMYTNTDMRVARDGYNLESFPLSALALLRAAVGRGVSCRVRRLASC